MTKLPKLLLANSDTLLTVKQKLQQGVPLLKTHLARLTEDADKHLSAPLSTVTDKKVFPPSGNIHDYMSLAPYWWPNPDTPDGLPYIRQDGEVNPERLDYDSPRMEAINIAVRELAFAYFFTNDERYSKKAAELLRTWFINTATRMNPNLQYSQFVPGVERKNGHGIIETHRFRWLCDAVKLLEGSSNWRDNDTQAVQSWFQEYLTWLLESEEGRAEGANKNNHAIWYTVQVVLFALFTNNTDIARQQLEKSKELIASQVDTQGNQPLETARSRSFHYCLFNLTGFLDLVTLGKHCDVDFINYEPIRSALEFLIPFAVGEKEWPYDQIDEIRWAMMAEILRRAAVLYNEPRYEKLIEKIPDGFLGAVDFGNIGSWFDLVEPPLTLRDNA